MTLVAKLFAGVALCAALTLGARLTARGGELERRDEPTAHGRHSRFHVYAPTAEARLFFEGTLVKGSGQDRAFYSPELEQGRRYAFTVVAVWVENGREVTHEMRVAFWAGDDVVIDFRR
jgi:uncharacterized protein (TIGR03000 family)